MGSRMTVHSAQGSDNIRVVNTNVAAARSVAADQRAQAMITRECIIKWVMHDVIGRKMSCPNGMA